jgi:hypothetical protein
MFRRLFGEGFFNQKPILLDDGREVFPTVDVGEGFINDKTGQIILFGEFYYPDEDENDYDDCIYVDDTEKYHCIIYIESWKSNTGLYKGSQDIETVMDAITVSWEKTKYVVYSPEKSEEFFALLKKYIQESKFP